MKGSSTSFNVYTSINVVNRQRLESMQTFMQGTAMQVLFTCAAGAYGLQGWV